MYLHAAEPLFVVLQGNKKPIDGEIDRAFIGERVLLSRNKMNL